jgi:hypothetical protein
LAQCVEVEQEACYFTVEKEVKRDFYKGKGRQFTEDPFEMIGEDN